MIALLAGLAFGGCDLAAAPDAPFEVKLPARAANVRLLIEVWATPSTRAWAEGVLVALAREAIPATLVVPFGPDPELIALADDARAAGHAVAVVLPSAEVPADPVSGQKRVKAALAPWRPVETVIVAAPTRIQEAVLGRAGVHEILRTDAAGNGAPALSAVFEGVPRTNVSLSAGPYTGPCGTDPRVGPFTPRAADRASQVIYGASGADWATVRVALDGERAAATDGAVLLRWLAEVVRPAGVVPTTAPAVRGEARLAARDVDPARAPAIGRLVPVVAVTEAAEALREPGLDLPRSLPGPMNLTEAFQAFLRISQDAAEGDVVRLQPLGPPIARATSTLPGAVEIPAASIRAVAGALLADAPEALPSAIPCEGRLLTASELLLALAGVVRGEDPVRVRPIEVPEPNAPGLGWGAAGSP